MLIDRHARGWIIACVAIFLVATGVYIPYALARPNGPSGGSWAGLAYGILGTAMMLFALLLGARKKVRTMRIGRAYAWMQGHVWFGLLSYPVVLYHAGFRWGGPLTQAIMWLFTLVIVSGIIGILIQQSVPTRMMREVAAETIYEQIDHVLRQLRDEAAGLVRSVTDRPSQQAFELEVVPAGGTAVIATQYAISGAASLVAFYEREVGPFLADRLPRSSVLAVEQSSDAAFAATRQELPAQFQPALDDLQLLVDERRQLERQRRLHHWMHGWLLVHVPLSYAMMILVVVHAIMALRFTSVGG